MDITSLEQLSEFCWKVPQTGHMRVPGILFASRSLLLEMDNKVLEQVKNVASLPGIVNASYAMPDAHMGYGFPVGGVAAFDADNGGVVSAGGVGFDISCGVRTLLTKVPRLALESKKRELADLLLKRIPAGVGKHGNIELSSGEIDDMLRGGAKWAVEMGYGNEADLGRIEDNGCASKADTRAVSDRAKERQRGETGSLGSGNHYAEIQEIAEIYDESTAERFGLRLGELVISIHCGSRGLGHQIATDYIEKMLVAAPRFGIKLADRDLACAPIQSELGQDYLGAMRAAINSALANRQVITHLIREAFADLFPQARLDVLYDVSHNTCKLEQHVVQGRPKKLYVHRKGATRALGPGSVSLAPEFRATGQPVIIGGSMGTSSYVLVGDEESGALSFASACHGAGRIMSRAQARKRWNGKELMAELEAKGIFIRSASIKGVAEEAPDAYKDVSEVVNVTESAGLARRIAKLRPVICVKG